MPEETAVEPVLRGLRAAASRAFIRAGLPASCSCVWIFPEMASASESSWAYPWLPVLPVLPPRSTSHDPLPLCVISAQSLGGGSPMVPPPSLETARSALAPCSHQHFVLRPSGKCSSEAACICHRCPRPFRGLNVVRHVWLLRWR